MALTNPTAMGLVVYGPDETSTEPVKGGRPAGEAAAERAEVKRKHYTAAFLIKQEQIVPFTMETYGYMDKDAVMLLRYLAMMRFDRALAANIMAKQQPEEMGAKKRTRMVGYGPVYRQLLERVAVTQQIGNARMLARYVDCCVNSQAW